MESTEGMRGSRRGAEGNALSPQRRNVRQGDAGLTRSTSTCSVQDAEGTEGNAVHRKGTKSHQMVDQVKSDGLSRGSD